MKIPKPKETETDYANIFLSSFVGRLQYKYSKLMMTSGGKECELPGADSCAIMEGEDAEDDLMDLTKKSFFTKIKSFSREVSDSFSRTHTHTDIKWLWMLHVVIDVFSEDIRWIWLSST